MRVKFLATLMIVGLIAFLLGPNSGQSQSPRGGGGGGGRGFGGSGFGGGGGGRGFGGAFDPNTIFDRMAKGGNTIKISEMVMGADRAADWAKSNNITNGELTREQFAEYSKTWSMGSRPGPTGSAGGTSDTAGPKPQDPAAQGGGGPGRGWGGRGGSDANAFTDFRFRQMDVNQDGFLDYEEMSENLKAEKDKWDTDKDGLINIEEFREYMKAWREKNQADREDTNRGGNPDSRSSEDRRGTLPPGSGGDEFPSVDLDKKVSVLRAGKLGDKMPAWFTDYDLDKDAQVALYEWKEKGGDLAEFQKWDLNGDGFITPDEVLRVNAVANKESGASSGDNRTASAGGASRSGAGGGAAAAGNFLAQLFGGRGGKGGGAPAAGGAGAGATGGGRNGFGGGGFGRGGGFGGGGFGGGGFGGGGMGSGGNPADAMFDRLARDRSSFNISEAGQMRASLTAYAESKGLSDGMITKEQFRDYWAQREANSNSGGGGGGGNRGRRGGR